MISFRNNSTIGEQHFEFLTTPTSLTFCGDTLLLLLLLANLINFAVQHRNVVAVQVLTPMLLECLAHTHRLFVYRLKKKEKHSIRIILTPFT